MSKYVTISLIIVGTAVLNVSFSIFPGMWIAVRQSFFDNPVVAIGILVVLVGISIKLIGYGFYLIHHHRHSGEDK